MSIRNPKSAIRISPRGLTLIELLVTVVIMVTVLAGVIPLMSPNNNSRKIREASRQLNSLIQQAQAQAARDGRPVGILFRELTAGPTSAPTFSGMALEVNLMAEPQPFAGFSDHSRVQITLPGTVYNPNLEDPGNLGSQFAPEFNLAPICRLNFVAQGSVDGFPPRMLRIGDTIEVAGNVFLICDDEDPYSMPNALEEVDGNGQETGYLYSDLNAPAPTPGTMVDCIWLNGDFNQATGTYLRPLPLGGSGVMYRIRRQPTVTSEAPLQFPRGIGIDLNGSGAAGADAPDDLDTGGPTVVGLMFGPNGGIEGLYLDGERLERIDRVYMLLGLFENGNPGSAVNPEWELTYDFIARPATSRDDFNARRTRINWLHPDAQWVTLNRAGRIVGSAVNTSYDPTSADFLRDIQQLPQDEQNDAQREKQIGEAREYAEQMQQEGGA